MRASVRACVRAENAWPFKKESKEVVGSKGQPSASSSPGGHFFYSGGGDDVLTRRQRLGDLECPCNLLTMPAKGMLDTCEVEAGVYRAGGSTSMEAQNVFPNQVHIGWPASLLQVLHAGIHTRWQERCNNATHLRQLKQKG